MKQLATSLLLTALCLAALPAAAQNLSNRSDAIWARATDDAITLDGVLDEDAWSEAETIALVYGQRAGDPGSGYKDEGTGTDPLDPLMADVRFLVSGNQLYLGATVEDNSIGGVEFNRFDGFLMKFRDASARDMTIGDAPVIEYFYAWMAMDGKVVPGADPQFLGPFGDRSVPENVERWDAATTVVGTSNDDSGTDERYVMEMRFDLGVLGYDATDSDGQQVAFSFSVYDVDGFFPFNDATFSSNRTWWQSPFGFGPNVGRVFVDPAVTVDTEPLPGMPYDFVIANGEDLDAPTIDGSLDEAVWDALDGFDIRFDDPDLRETYPGVGPLVSGQFQPDIDGDPDNDLPTVVDPADATVKWFHDGSRLYVGVDVRDAALSASDMAGPDFWDGFRLSINDRAELEPNDNYLLPLPLSVRLNEAGELVAEETLAGIANDDPDAVDFAASVDGTVNDPSDADGGYQIEMAFDLDVFGYPSDLGDNVLFVGANVFDYDALDDPTASYGSRAWFFREFGNDRAAAYALLNPDPSVASEDGPGAVPALMLLGAAPNPFGEATVLRYALPEAGRVTVDVYDVLGRRVRSLALGTQPEGANAVRLDAAGFAAGTYLYRVSLDGASGANLSPVGKITLVR